MSFDLRNKDGETREELQQGIDRAMRLSILHNIEEHLQMFGKYISPSWASKIEKRLLEEMIQNGKIVNNGDRVYERCNNDA